MTRLAAFRYAARNVDRQTICAHLKVKSPRELRGRSFNPVNRPQAGKSKITPLLHKTNHATKIRELVADLEKPAGFTRAEVKEAIASLLYPGSPRKIILSGSSGADAHQYQEKLVKAAIREVRK